MYSCYTQPGRVKQDIYTDTLCVHKMEEGVPLGNYYMEILTVHLMYCLWHLTTNKLIKYTEATQTHTTLQNLSSRNTLRPCTTKINKYRFLTVLEYVIMYYRQM